MKLAVLISFSGAGGVERMVMNLVREFAQQYEQLDLLVIRARGPHFANIPDNVSIIKLRSSHTLTAIPELMRYFKDSRPDAMLVAKDRAGRAAVIAKSLAGAKTRIVVRLGTNLSTALAHRSRISAWWRTAPMRRIYAKVDQVVAVSQGVADDVHKITGLDKDRISVIRNPVITDDFDSKAQAPFDHPWLNKKTCPVVIGVGRLSEQKDFATLINAFAKLLERRPCRLIILGDGALRQDLEAQITRLGLNEQVALPGFQDNPMCWVKAADLFVLSSRWEGSPNALTEALAVGTASVSMRCPSGPNETLDEGRFGPLVAVGDADGLTEAMDDTLNNPLPSDVLRSAVDEYRAKTSALAYLKILSPQIQDTQE
ncbi:MAG: glycosyl transferase [Alteromonadaceae bacterium]|nr:MAG: glycosyl transferase [Alteromonadaceae bacterium]